MSGLNRFRLSSLRGKLGIAAFGGLLTTAIVTVLLLLTANAASEVVDSARQSQERSRIYLQLQSTATDYQHASFGSIRDTSPIALRRVAETRNRLDNLLAEALRLPVTDRDDRTANTRIESQVSSLIEHFAHSEELVARVNEQWQNVGGQAAMLEANKISAPIYTLRETLQAEITRGDGKVAAATLEAETLIEAATIAALIALALALGFSAAVMFLLQTRLRSGLDKLGEGALAVREGNLNHRINLRGDDELSDLSGAFDSMAETISEKQKALQDIQAGLEHAIAARTAELEKAHAELSKADESRRAFFAEVSHELRTPLTVIKGETQVALRSAEKPGFDPHGPFDRILQQTELLARMVNDLFLIARAHAGGLPLERKIHDVRHIAKGVVNDFENLAAENGGSIILADGSGALALVDESRVKRALAALIENAMVHCQSGVQIKLAVKTDADFTSICVFDNGPGLDFANSDSLFERFQRGTSGTKGSGLGLSLVRALAKAHGGTATLRAAEGGGTCAKVSFPRYIEKQEAA